MRDNRKLHLLFSFLGALVLLFIIAPMAGMFLSASKETLLETTQNEELRNSIQITLITAFAATFVASLFIIPLAYLLARYNFKGKKIVLAVIDLPVVIPHTAAGIAILGIISRDSAVGKAAGILGLNLIGHPIGISMAMAFVSLPFLFNAAHDGFAAVPERLEKAALNLKASPAKVFFSISLPLAQRNIISGFVMMFARGMSEFGAVVIVAYHPMTAPVLIYEWFTSFGLNYARPAAVIFVLVSLFFFLSMRLLSGNPKSNRHD